MSAVYSTCFLAVGGITTSAAYVVPGGHIAVLHSMTMWVPTDEPMPIGDPGWDVALDDPLAYIWSMGADGLLKGAYQWSGREVFGQFLNFRNAGISPFSFRANGSLLTLP
jgi:hypothetical protein